MIGINRMTISAEEELLRNAILCTGSMSQGCALQLFRVYGRRARHQTRPSRESERGIKHGLGQENFELSPDKGKQ